MSFIRRWNELEPIGRASSGGYRRFAWTPEDSALREWFATETQALGLDLVLDRAGNQWAWWGDPDSAPGVVTGSHLDSVPDGGAFDGPLGVVSALATVEALQAEGFRPGRPIGVVNFADEEGARFGVACAGSRVITGAMSGERAAGLRDGDGTALGEAMGRAGLRPEHLGRDDETLRRIGCFIELHVEQGKALATEEYDAAIGVGTAIWPHGRWRFDFPGEANHAGTTRLADRDDPMLAYASTVLAARRFAIENDSVATFGKLLVEPNGVNAIPSMVRAWLDARGPVEPDVLALLGELTAAAEVLGATVSPESWTGTTAFDADLASRLSGMLGGAPLLGTGAGHDAGILATAGFSTGMLFVRNPTGVSHSPAEFAEEVDCLAGVEALTTVIRELGVVSYWAPYAWLPTGIASRVRISVDPDGLIGSVETDVDASDGDRRLPGVLLPGLANAHSHAFHRALRGRTHADGGSFWTWRTVMYQVAGRLDPDSYLALARAVYAEMALAGITSVGEFHYLHHDRDGRRYTDPNAMGEALRQAATDAGIRLTLLDTCYLTGGLTTSGHTPLEGVQRRFGDGDADSWAARVSDLKPSAGFRVGAAIHSVRAVPREQLGTVSAFTRPDAGRPLHVHLSEQPAENEACLAYYGLTPAALLGDSGALSPQTSLIHATHLTQGDIASLSGSFACFCPTTERDLADGIGPARALADAGATITLGSDQHAVIDLFEEARGLEMHERLSTRQRGRFAPGELLAALTVDGQRSLGWPELGLLRVGAPADLIAVRLDSVRTAGTTPQQVVLSAGAPDVDTVLVGGEVVVSEGRHRLGDVGSLLTEAIETLLD